MENFTMESNKNNQEKESEFLSLEFFKKAVKRFTLASAIFLASFGASEAQQKSEKFECSTQTTTISHEEAVNLEKKAHEIDSLSDVLFEKAKDHNLLQTDKTSPKTKWEVDSSEHLYYRSKDTVNGIVVYETVSKFTNALPSTAASLYTTDVKFIAGNHKLYFFDTESMGVSNYNNPSSIREGNLSKGNKYVIYNKDSKLNNNEFLRSTNHFTKEEFIKSLEDVTQKLKEEIKLVEGM